MNSVDWTPDIPVQLLAMISLCMGLFVPWIAAYLNQAHWPSALKRAVVFLISIVCAGAALRFYGKLDTGNLATATLTVMTAAVWFYRNFFDKAIQDFEVKTTVGENTSDAP